MRHVLFFASKLKESDYSSGGNWSPRRRIGPKIEPQEKEVEIIFAAAVGERVASAVEDVAICTCSGIIVQVHCKYGASLFQKFE
jgi:hypothetical protein